ncbi:MAG: SLBB domain-containing protein [bacterium]
MNALSFNTKRLIRFLSFGLIFVSFLTASFDAGAQSGLEGRDLSQVRSEDISDEQLMNYVQRGKERGYSVQEMMQTARQRGLPSSVANRLLRRIRRLEQTQASEGDRSQFTERERDTLSDTARRARREDALDEVGRRIFGAQLFSQKSPVFEPSMNIPTPRNYELGAGDEIVIDIWGQTSDVHRLNVSKEGTITIENLSPLYVHGLSIKEAEKRIIEQLKELYRGLRPDSSGQTTFARVHLSDLRSIQVTVMGEVREPGNYTISSLSTVFNALYKARGPNNIGSYRDIKVIRGKETVAELDVYDLLVNGNQDSNIRLQDQDIIKVDPYETRVDVRGAVKREGYFEMKEEETLEDLLNFTGGFSDSAYTEKVRIHRNTTSQKRIETVNKENFSTFKPKTGDVLFADKVIDRFENRVEITGAVWRPGEYELEEDMTLHDLIMEADGLRPDAYRSRAIINRLKENFEFELVSVDLNRLMEHPPRHDIKLRPEDEVVIQNIFSMREEYIVSIGGAVSDTGDYTFHEGMTIEDLILKADGFKESASEGRIEIFRRISENQPTQERSANLAESYRFSVNRDLSMREKDKQFELKPFDQVFVRKKPNYEIQRNVEIEGQVMYPGTYAIESRNERISDLIERSGGLTSEAYLAGATLLREREVEEREEVDLELGAGEEVNSENRVNRADTVDRKETEEIPVGIDLADIMENPGSSKDLFLREGDKIRVPKELQTVKVSGAVLREVELRHEQGRRLNYYINRAGGYAQNAFNRRAYVVYANGRVEARRNFLLFSVDPKITPGAEIIIPEKADREPMDTREFVSLMSSIASTAAVIVSILR